MTFMSPNRDAYSVWAPLQVNGRFVYPSWRRSFSFDCNVANGMPFLQFIDKKGVNICSFALTDFFSDITLSAGIDERSGLIEITAEIAAKSILHKPGYSAFVYCDRSPVPYYEAIYSFNRYREKLGFVPSFTPESARRRTYSTWYAFQKGITADDVFSQTMLAKEYGMNTVIIDDGWQTPVCDQKTNAYINAGDWEPYTPKFPDMRALVDRLHGNGVKVVLWVATPFIGIESKAAEFMSGRFVGSNRKDGTVLIPDLRYADIREWYVSVLTDRLKSWKLDGFKLDFIDCFRLTYSEAVTEEMDCPDFNTAVGRLMSQISSALRAINPEVMLEFREPYVGPVMQMSGNMIRVDDCAYGAMYNKVNGINLRLAAPEAAIHSDMLMWDYSASPEAAADQLSALLFVVPQISMRFDRLCEEHKKVLKFYLDFIDDNREILQKGKLVPLHPEADYSVVYAEKNGRVIAGLYGANSFVLPDNTSSAAIVNACDCTPVFVSFGSNDFSGRKYTVYNCMGDIVSNGVISSGLCAFSVPLNGILML